MVLTEIYPARELPIAGVTSELIYNNLRPGIEKTLLKKNEVISFLTDKQVDIVIVLGAGDLESQMPEITELLKNR